MTRKPWYRKTTKTLLLWAVAICLLILYLSLLMGASIHFVERQADPPARLGREPRWMGLIRSVLSVLSVLSVVERGGHIHDLVVADMARQPIPL